MAATTNGGSGRERDAVRATEPIGDATERPACHFTRAELDALSVHDDVVLRIADGVPGVPDGGRIAARELPHWASAAPDEGAAIAVWQMLAAPPGLTLTLASWLRKQGISYFRGWIRHAGPGGPDFVMDWVMPREDATWELIRDGDAGPYSPPPGCDLQTFVDAVAALSRDFMLVDFERKFRMIGRLPGDPDTVLQEFFPLPESAKGLRERPTARQMRTGRNDPCPCGSGSKFKRCHGSQ